MDDKAMHSSEQKPQAWKQTRSRRNCKQDAHVHARARTEDTFTRTILPLFVHTSLRRLGGNCPHELEERLDALAALGKKERHACSFS